MKAGTSLGVARVVDLKQPIDLEKSEIEGDSDSESSQNATVATDHI